MVEALGCAYTSQLEQYHGWLIRKTFGIVSAQAPDYPTVLRLLSPGLAEDERESVVRTEMKAFVKTVLFLFFIRRHTPFSPYVAPRFPHMSEINFSVFVFLGRAAREGAREGLRRSWARGSAQGVERRKSAAVHGCRATQIRRGMQSISPYTQNNGGRTVSYICSRARRERNVYSQSSLKGRCRRLGNEHDST